MARVLVTGASGFIGTKLTERLVARGDDVTCLVRASSKRDALAPLGVRFALGDVRDPAAVRAAVQGADVVYHLAGLVTAFRASDLMAVNAEACRHVLAACAEISTPPTVVFVSSLAAAGPSRDRARTEIDPAEPVSNYGRAKRAGEVICQEFAARVPITIVRPPIVFGEGDRLMCDLFRSVSRFGIHLAVGVARSRYSLVHVSDLCDALVLSAKGGTRLAPCGSENPPGSPGYYFVTADEQPTFGELGRLIGISLGRQRVRVFSPPGPILLWLGAALAEVAARARRKPHIFNFDKVREAAAGDWTCSSETIRRELGFSPQAPLAERLRQTAEWYRQHNWL